MSNIKVEVWHDDLVEVIAALEKIVVPEGYNQPFEVLVNASLALGRIRYYAEQAPKFDPYKESA